MSASATLTPTATARKSVFLPSQGFPNLPTVVPQPSGDNSSTGPTVLLVLLPVLFGSLMLLAIGLGVAQYYRQRAREQQRQSGLRTARLRRGSTHPFTTHEMSVVNRPDLETGFSRYDQTRLHRSSCRASLLLRTNHKSALTTENELTFSTAYLAVCTPAHEVLNSIVRMSL
ncbi:hypothetical protein BMF94_1026 [Rhodotorula taiwanensis]|uniref:Uncharacterized protein n=1 Tax=Rhodotorula taiwanensis TaxID=741276 RepID=A0A2S5BGQ2_9BASI|nr:hypothetical protein BMF94_1026 [Rhodotorula taiwanensis]